MISQLTIQGLAIIDHLSIEFSPGFNVITGETGAGKSILIRGLNFLMGAKASADAVRQGFEQATVTGDFLVPQGHPALMILERLGIAVDYGDAGASILMRRQLSNKGRSQSWVNDVLVTSGPLRELGRTLVDVFGQHENQRLFDESQHTAYVDGFLTDGTLRGRVVDRYRECQTEVTELQRLVEAFHEGQRNRDYVGFRLDALKRFDASAEDFERVASLCRRAESLVRVKSSLSKSVALLDGDDSGAAPGKVLAEASRLLSAVPGAGDGELARIPELSERAATLARELDDLSFELGRLASTVDIDESEVETAQERLFGYQDLFRRHGAKGIEALLAEEARLDGELKHLESTGQRIEEGLHRLAEKVEGLLRVAGELSRARRVAAESIKKKVRAELEQLAMPGAQLDVRFAAVERQLPALDIAAFGESLVPLWTTAAEKLCSLSEAGAERSEFLLAPNPGEPCLPLARIASGGEMSRIMLALKKALVADAETCVLVFDEIDSGISGRVADIVGQKLQELSRGFQVICISHLPQVAVYADAHFLVHKREQKSQKKAGQRTESSIVRLNRDESAREIARLLSGDEVSSPSLQNALSLIERAQSRKPAGSPVSH